MKSSPPPLEPAVVKALCDYSIRNLVPPDDILRVSVGRRPGEPFLINYTQISNSHKEKNRFLSILAALYKGSKRRFEEAAPSVKGTSRIYFGKTIDEVYSTGSSNWAEKIPETPWYVSVNSDGSRKARIVSDLMNAMGFSSDYCEMVSSLCFSEKARLPFHYALAYRKIEDQG